MSPQNSATGTTSRKPADTNRQVAAKFAPEAVAVSMRVIRPSPPLRLPGPPPTANAMIRMKGSAASTPPITSVRRRRHCRSASTRSGSVRFAR